MTETIGGTTQAGAGWYQDPLVPGALRWWSGASWTEHTAPLPAPPNSEHPEPVTAASSPAPVAHSVPRPDASDVTPALQSRFGTIVPTDTSDVANSSTEFSTDNASARRQRRRRTRAGRAARIAGDGRPAVRLRTTTGSVWVLAFLPWLSLLWTQLSPFLAGLVHEGTAFGLTTFAPLALPIVLIVLLAFRDRVALIRFGHRGTASELWALLTPLAYLIARVVHLRGRGIAPLVALVLNAALVIGVTVGSPYVLPRYATDADAAIFDSGIHDALARRGSTMTALCPTGVDVSIDSRFTCIGYDQGMHRHTVAVHVIDTDDAFTCRVADTGTDTGTDTDTDVKHA